MKQVFLGFGAVIVLAGVTACGGPSSPEVVVPAANNTARDGAARQQMRIIYRAEEGYKSKNDRYGTIDELVDSGDLNVNPKNDRLFKYTLSATKDTFQCVGMPVIYNTNGKTSLYIDQTGQLRGADHQGGPALASDPVITE
ncbi:MAG: hypothetical protein K1Y36_06960 [Blastocatellia bacterium]|nr:hypothetical protein [Blastocatellia bacterium]